MKDTFYKVEFIDANNDNCFIMFRSSDISTKFKYIIEISRYHNKSLLVSHHHYFNHYLDIKLNKIHNLKSYKKDFIELIKKTILEFPRIAELKAFI